MGGREPSARGLTPTQTPSTTRKLRVSTLEFPAAPGGRNQPLAVRPSTALPILEPKWLRLRRTHLGPHVAPKGSLGREASLPENAVSTNVEQGGDWAQSWQIPDDGTSAGITPHVLQYAHSSDVFPRSGCAGVQSACRLQGGGRRAGLTVQHTRRRGVPSSPALALRLHGIFYLIRRVPPPAHRRGSFI